MTPPDPGSLPGRLLFVAANPSIDRLYELDRLVVGEIHRPRSMIAVPGGKGLNAARVASVLGGTATAVGIIAGRAGDWIVEGLAGLGIEARMARAGGETRSCVSILDRATGELSEVYEAGTKIDGADWDALEAIVRGELERGDLAAIAISGSLPPGAPGDGYARIARIARAAAASYGPVPLLVDTYGPALAAVLGERPAVVKLNAAEAGEASAVPVVDAESAVAAAGVLRQRGAVSVVVSMGTAGAVVVDGAGATRLLPPDVRGAYPVGSGDAFLGGLAVALARGEPLVEAARLGMAAGIANAQVPGAGVLDPAAMPALLGRITLAAI